MGHSKNTDKNRKSDAQEIFDQADNAGRFAGNDADAKAAHQQANENLRQDVNRSTVKDNADDSVDRIEEGNRDRTDAEARRDRAQTHDYKGEAQNVNDDSGRPITNEDELQHARNKATESKENPLRKSE